MFKRLKRKLSTYPSCDHLNIALAYLLKNPEANRFAIEEIRWAIVKSGGYFYSHVAKGLEALKKEDGKDV